MSPGRITENRPENKELILLTISQPSQCLLGRAGKLSPQSDFKDRFPGKAVSSLAQSYFPFLYLYRNDSESLRWSRHHG